MSAEYAQMMARDAAQRLIVALRGMPDNYQTEWRKFLGGLQEFCKQSHALKRLGGSVGYRMPCPFNQNDFPAGYGDCWAQLQQKAADTADATRPEWLMDFGMALHEWWVGYGTVALAKGTNDPDPMPGLKAACRLLTVWCENPFPAFPPFVVTNQRAEGESRKRDADAFFVRCGDRTFKKAMARYLVETLSKLHEGGGKPVKIHRPGESGALKNRISDLNQYLKACGKVGTDLINRITSEGHGRYSFNAPGDVVIIETALY